MFTSLAPAYLELLEYEITDQPFENRQFKKLLVQLIDNVDIRYDKAQQRRKVPIPDFDTSGRNFSTYPRVDDVEITLRCTGLQWRRG